MLTQWEKIIEYMKRRGSITAIQGAKDLDITKVSTRCNEMIRAGVPIEKEHVQYENKFGEKRTYTRYRLDVHCSSCKYAEDDGWLCNYDDGKREFTEHGCMAWKYKGDLC